MSREIKFRAWDGEKMIYPLEGYMFDSTVIGNDFPGGITITKMGRKKIELMQYTGLKDKNGNEIYEGDLLLLHDKVKLAVRFESGAYVLYHINPEYGRWGLLSRPYDYDFKDWGFEIIGNIFQNPELIQTPTQV